MKAEEVIARFARAGYSPITLAETLELPLDQVLDVYAETGLPTVVPDDDALRHGARLLAWRAMREAMVLLEEGSIANRINVISRIMGPLAKMMSDGEPDAMESLRADMASLMREVRATAAIGQPPVDSDQGPDR